MLSNNAYTQEYFDIMESLGGDIESRRAAYDYMKNSTAIVHHQVISTSFVPRLYDRRTREIMRTTVETTHRVLGETFGPVAAVVFGLGLLASRRTA